MTLIASSHCPGSVMFLFESAKAAVLYTGDLRAEEWYVNSLSHHPSLTPYYNGMTHLDCMYIDTTFAYRGQPYIDIPPNAYGIQSLINLLERYSENTIFIFNTLTIGYEMVWVAIASRFKTQIHVDPYLFNLYRCIAPQSNDLIGRVLVDNYLTTSETASRFHACQKSSGCLCRSRNDAVFITPVVNKSQDAIDAYNTSRKLADFKIFQLHNPLSSFQENFSQEPDDKAEDSVFVCDFRRHVLAKDKEHILPATLHFYFSRHASYAEMKNLVQAFLPKRVRGIFTPQNDSNYNIASLFKDAIYVPTKTSSSIDKKYIAFPLFGAGKPCDKSIIAPSMKQTTIMPYDSSQNTNSIDSMTRSAILTMLNKSFNTQSKLSFTKSISNFEPIGTIDSLTFTTSSKYIEKELVYLEKEVGARKYQWDEKRKLPPDSCLVKKRRMLAPKRNASVSKRRHIPTLVRNIKERPLIDYRLKRNLTILRSFYEGNLKMGSVSIDISRIVEIEKQILSSNCFWWYQQKFSFQ